MSAQPAAPVLIQALIEHLATHAFQPTTVSWLNHFSVQQENDGSYLSTIDIVGIDGIFLAKLLGRHVARTSADVVVPLLLASHPFRSVAMVGGASGVASSKIDEVRALIAQPNRTVVSAFDGFRELQSLLGDVDGWYVRAGQPDLILLGLGARLQNEVAVRLAEALPCGLIVTCGGWIDQVGTNYYPSWAYPLRLNWLVRLVKSPRLLARRYTIDAIGAYVRRRRIRAFVNALPGYCQYIAVTGGSQEKGDGSGSEPGSGS